MTSTFKSTMTSLLMIGTAVLFAFAVSFQAWAVPLLDRDITEVDAVAVDAGRIVTEPNFEQNNLGNLPLTQPAHSAVASFVLTTPTHEFTYDPGQYFETSLAHTNPVPEPSTVLLLGIGLTFLAIWRLRKGVVC